MISQNIPTIFNPFTAKYYDMGGNEVEEVYYRDFQPTGIQILPSDVVEYAQLKPTTDLEKYWIDWCVKFVKKI